MPREQRTGLKKTAVEETTKGVFESKPVGTVDMPVVSPQKTSGQALAEGIGLVAKGLATFVKADIDDKAKVTNIRQRAYGGMEGRSAANDIIANLPSTKRDALGNEIAMTADDVFKYFREQSNARIAALSEGNEAVHEEYLRSFATTTNSLLADEHEKFLATDRANAENRDNLAAGELLINSMSIGQEDGATLQENYKTFYAGKKVDNATIGKNYVVGVSAFIKEQAQKNENYDWHGAIEQYLKITTKDGVNYADHPTYGKLIDQLESSLTTLNKARATAANQEAIKQENAFTNNAILDLSIGNASHERISQIREELDIRKDSMSTEKFSKVTNALSAVLDRQGFGRVSDSKILSIFKDQAERGELNYNLIEYNKHKISNDDYLAVLNTQAKYERDYEDEAKRGRMDAVKNAQVRGRGQVATLNAEGMVITIGDDTGGEERAFQFDQQWTAWLQSWREANNNDWPPADVAFSKATEISNTVNTAQQPRGIPNIPNYILINSYLESKDVPGFNKAIEDGKFTLEQAKRVRAWNKANPK